MGHWTRHWTNRVPGHLRGSIRELSRSMPVKQNIIERTTTTMVARGLHSDFSLGDSDANETDVRYWHLAIDADDEHVRTHRRVTQTRISTAAMAASKMVTF